MDDPQFIASFCVKNNLSLDLQYLSEPDWARGYWAKLQTFNDQELEVQLDQLVSVVEQALKCVRERAQDADGNVARLLSASRDAASPDTTRP